MTDRDKQIIRAFLSLPSGALPVAGFVDDCDCEDFGSAWPYLRDALRREQRLNNFGGQVLLAADRPEWRDGVVVTLD